MKFKIVEIYDGRLPEYQVIDEINNQVVKTFDSYKDAEKWCNTTNNLLPCGEEDPCS